MSPREKRDSPARHGKECAGTTVSGTLGALGARTGKEGDLNPGAGLSKPGRAKWKKGHNEELNKQDRTPTETDETRRTAPESR